MVYKRYIKRGKKLHGPYYYESYRDEEGTSRKRYLGKKSVGRFSNLRQKKLLFVFLFLGLLIVSLFLFFSSQEKITSMVILETIDEETKLITNFSKVSGNLVQEGGIFTVFENGTSEGVFVGGNFSWTNYVLEGKVTNIRGSGGLGLIFRFVDSDNYYIAYLAHDDQNFELWRREGGWLFSQSVPYPNELGEEYLLKIDVNEDSFDFFVNDIQQFTVNDSSISSGKIGLYTWNQDGQFRDVMVQVNKVEVEK